MNEDARKERSLTEPRDERGRFGPGNSGRPRGARNRVTAAAEAIIDDAIGDVAQKAVELALAGDVGCIRAVLRLRLPALRDHSVQEPIELPALTTPKDATAALRIITEVVARGEIDADHARSLVAVVEAFLKSLETVQLNDRLAALEQRIAQSQATSQAPRH
jgi:hypothetical protein